MNETTEVNTGYEKRYFDTRTGDVALMCCTRCGTIVWSTELHERAYHDNEDTDEVGTEEVGTGQEGGTVTVEDFGINEQAENVSGTGGSTLGVSGGAPTPRPVSSPPARGTGRTTAAGSGKQARR